MVRNLLKYFYFLFILNISLSAQSISVLASVDSSDYLIGDYINYTLEVRADKNIEVIITRMDDIRKAIDAYLNSKDEYFKYYNSMTGKFCECSQR